MNEKEIVKWQTLLEEISSKVPQSLLNEIYHSPHLKNKIEICYNTTFISSALKEWLSRCVSRPRGHKSSDLSTRYREAGNVYCRKKDNLSAIKAYNKALLYAPQNSAAEKAAYGNRSLVLMKIDRVKECLWDIDRALDGDRFARRNLTLLLRKIHGYMILGQGYQARGLVDELMAKYDSLPKDVQIELSQASVGLTGNDSFTHSCDVEDGLYENCDYPLIDFLENTNFRFASMSLNLMKSERKGRYVVANEDVSIGDVLFAERPFAFVILPDMIGKYCDFCCRRVFAPVPCDSCSATCYCSEKCRASARRSFHEWECGGLEVCYSIGIVHLALRVALIGRSAGSSERYCEVEKLLSHLSDLQPSELFSYSVTATLLAIYLENYKSFFKHEARKDELFELGGTLLLHIGQLVCNGHAITDIESCESAADATLLVENQVRVATAIYPSASMMNHSCKPNIINSFYNSLLIVRATENLKKGDEVYNCYGPMVYNTELSKRQELLLSQYFFVCDCTACSERQGPISDKLVCKECFSQLSLETSSCENCSLEVDAGKLFQDLKQSDIAFQQGIEKTDEGEFFEAIACLSKALKLREQHCHKNHRKLFECRDSLAKCYSMTGHEEVAFSFLEKNLAAIESIYGEISIELGQEIMKLLSVATSLRRRNEKLTSTQRKILEKSLEFGNKGLFIFKLSYGDWHPRFHELKKHLNYLDTFKEELVAESGKHPPSCLQGSHV